MFLRSHAKTLFHLPQDIFETGLFPLLSVNEVLGLRRVCKFTKTLADDYLRIHPRSRNDITITIEDSFVEGDVQLENFLLKDSASTIRMPISRFQIMFASYADPLAHPLLPDFLTKYGRQIRHLTVPYLSIPMKRGEKKFYEQLPKLRTLSVKLLHLNPVGQGSANTETLQFSETFRNLTKLDISWVSQYVSRNNLWKLFEFCTELVHFRIPSDLYEKPLRLAQDLDLLHQILDQKKHNKLRILEFSPVPMILYTYMSFRWHWEMGCAETCSKFQGFTKDLADFVTKFDLTLVNVCGHSLISFPRIQLEKIANHVVSLSMAGVNCELIKDHLPVAMEFPRLESLTHFHMSRWDTGQLRLILKPTNFPALRKLEVDYPTPFLAYMWKAFPNLEDVMIGTTEFISENHAARGIFTSGAGDDGESDFLKLANLKKLSLVNADKIGFLKDIVFSTVFRHMTLKEFYLMSKAPITSFTAAGIRALLRGRFMETIEKFPFDKWSLRGTKPNKFNQLARKFPSNQPF